MAIKVYAQRNEKWQREGVAVYLNIEEIYADLLERYPANQIPSKHRVAKDVEEFLDDAEIVSIREYPEGGYFPTTAAFESACTT